MRRVLFIVGWALAGAIIQAVIFGFSLLVGSEDPDDVFEQATFRTEKVDAVAGASVADGACAESKDSNGQWHSHGTSYEIDLTWTGGDGERHTGVMTHCDPPDEGEQVTVWVTSRNAVFNRSPLAMYTSVPVAAVLFAAGAWTWTWLKKDDRRTRGSESWSQRRRRLRLRRLRLRQLRRATKRS